MLVIYQLLAWFPAPGSLGPLLHIDKLCGAIDAGKGVINKWTTLRMCTVNWDNGKKPDWLDFCLFNVSY